MTEPLGIFAKFADLTEQEQEIVRRACEAADQGAAHELSYKSNFPVGSAILARNRAGESRIFAGCNVENEWMPAGICAERNAATTAAYEGYKCFQIVSVFCRKFPGGSPCGMCRQVLFQFGRESALLAVVDHDKSVRKSRVEELLPAAQGLVVQYKDMSLTERKLVNRVQELKRRSHVPYSKAPRAALFLAANHNGQRKIFAGVSDDNASYGASALAEAVAMRAARCAGFGTAIELVTMVVDLHALNPVEGECLQVLREFGENTAITLVSSENASVKTSLEELLPDSFGPEAL
ncbi:MAG: cytidine deaminase [Candidatus Obscuribacterales bacterium]|nr:cytidine deaminase [Candidatus Obscuribacterales bacterium]